MFELTWYETNSPALVRCSPHGVARYSRYRSVRFDYPGARAAPTQVNSCTTISSPGAYQLTSDITNAGASECIIITSDDVVFDGGGHTIDGQDSLSTGILVQNADSLNSATPIHNVTIRDITITDWANGIEQGKAVNGLIENATIRSNGYGIALYKSDRNTFEANTIDANDYYGISISSGSAGNVFVDNTINASGFHGIASFGRNETYRNNTVSDSGYVGLRLDTKGVSRLINNTVSDNGNDGIELLSMSNTELHGNLIESNGGDGIYIAGGSNNRFVENVITGSGGVGINIRDRSINNTFVNTAVFDNDGPEFVTAGGSTSTAIRLFTRSAAVSFESKDVKIEEVASPPEAPTDRAAIGQYLNITTEGAGSYLDVDFHYSDIRTLSVNESTLELWHNDGTWSVVSDPNAVDVQANVVGANITGIDGVITPLGMPRPVEVNIMNRTDPLHNGSIKYVVQGKVSGNVSAIENVTVSLNGREMQVPLSGSKSLGTGVFATELILDQQVNTIEVTATSGPENSQTDTATLNLDGDGLVDTYERNATGTDPLDPDSDSTKTSANEAGNGVIDGLEDLDVDGLANAEEYAVETEPLTADTDADGLDDGFEVLVMGTDPLVADSDDDGTLDGQEDPDGDGLTNAAEEDANTDPTLADGDGDGLADPDELDGETDPLDFDTDNDSLEDGDELQPAFGTDPLNPDSDGDGIPDGNETYTTVVRNQSLGIRVGMIGAGNASKSVSIERPTNVIFGEYAPWNVPVSAFVELESEQEFDQAALTISYNESRIIEGNESTLAIYTYNETTDTYDRLDSTTDPTNNTVTATTNHFSTYVVFDEVAWERIQSRDIPTQLGGSAGYITDEPRDTNLNRFVIHREKPSGGQSRLFIYLSDGYGEAFGTLQFRDVTIDGLFNTRSGGSGLDSQGDGSPPPGSTSTRCDNDEIYQLNSTTIDFNLDTCRVNDEFKVPYSITGPNPAIRVDYRRLDGSGVTLGGAAPKSVPEGEWIPLTNGSVQDEDEDGIPNYIENGTYPLNNGPNVSTDWNDNDTDGDRLLDGEEVNINSVGDSGYRWTSNPSDGDTDRDRLLDSLEVNGWTISVINKSGTPHRWDYANEKPGESIHVTSDAKDSDTDGDGATDFQEYHTLHTDPNATITYGITKDHQTDVINASYKKWDSEELRAGASRSIQALGLVQDDESPAVLRNQRLTDGTDDFDFITSESASGPVFNRFGFTALDRRERTDTWLSNRAELDERIDPWDPDHDDDGLTDGQEVKHITRRTPDLKGRVSVIADISVTSNTNPRTPDTDGDGYWDGWIGVYDVGRTDNVVLYVEHLQSGNGVQGNEIVQEQIGTHEMSAAPSAVGADIDSDPAKEHSNVHLGELKWGTTPTDRSDRPTPTLDFEVDYYAGADAALDTPMWRQSIEDNYALYGINVTLTKDQTLTDNDLTQPYPGRLRIPRDNRPPFSESDLFEIETAFHDTSAEQYLFVASEPDSDLGSGQTGVYRFRRPLLIGPKQELIAVFTTSHQGVLGTTSRLNLTRDERMRAVTAKTTVHEIGHVLGVGENDDNGAEEVYSGDIKDDTKEDVKSSVAGGSVQTWSVMSNGINRENFLPPTDTLRSGLGLHRG